MAAFLVAAVGLIGVLAGVGLAQPDFVSLAVADSGDPVANGDNLRAAVAEAAASGANEALIEVATGTFDLNGASLELPNGIQVVGAGAEATTICHCAISADGVLFTDATLIVSLGHNIVAGVTITDGGGAELGFDNLAGELVVEDSILTMAIEASFIEYSPRQMVRVQSGSFTMRNSSITGQETNNSGRGIVAEGTSSVSIDNSTLNIAGTSAPLIIMDSGELDVVNSQLSANVQDGPADLIRMNGPGSVNIDGGEFRASAGYGDTVAVRMIAGGTLTIDDAFITGGADQAYAVHLNDVDATIVNVTSEGTIKAVGGTVELRDTALNLDSFRANGTAFDLTDSSGSMLGGAVTYTDFEDFDPPTVTDIYVGNGTFLFDRVEMVNARILNDPGVVCLSTSNVDIVDYRTTRENAEPVATHRPPIDCAPAIGEPGADCGRLAQQAELATVAGAFVITEDPTASDGSFVVVPDDVGNVYAATDEHIDTNYIEFCVRVEQPGTFVIEAETIAPNRNSDSFWVTVGGDANPTALWHVPQTTSWSNSTVFDRSLSVPLTYRLDAGDHLVRFVQREDNTALDSIELVRVGGVDSMGEATCVGLDQYGRIPTLQAEDGAVNGTIEVGTDGRNGYVGSSELAGDRYDLDPTNYVELCFTVADDQAGSYALRLATIAPDNRSDSFFVQMDDGEPTVTHLRISESWNREAPLRNATTYRLEPGEHRVRLYQREDGVLLDEVQLWAVSIDPQAPTPTPMPTPTPAPPTDSCVPGGISNLPLDQCAVLNGIHRSMGGSSWIDDTGWVTTANPCSWFGVTCNADGTSVIELDLGRNGVTGAITNNIGLLTDLAVLDLSDNQLSGELPSGLFELSNLRVLQLSATLGLTGEIPPEIGQLTNLELLDLSINGFSGAIPAEIGSLTSLNSLVLAAAGNLSGPIPVEIGQLTNLTNLRLDGNGIEGTIPAELGNLVNLEILGLSNALSGEIPSELTNLVNLRSLSIAGTGSEARCFTADAETAAFVSQFDEAWDAACL